MDPLPEGEAAVEHLREALEIDISEAASPDEVDAYFVRMSAAITALRGVGKERKELLRRILNRAATDAVHALSRNRASWQSTADSQDDEDQAVDCLMRLNGEDLLGKSIGKRRLA